MIAVIFVVAIISIAAGMVIQACMTSRAVEDARWNGFEAGVKHGRALERTDRQAQIDSLERRVA